jgi:hypothetical protein
MIKHGQVLKTLCKVKEARHTRPYVILSVYEKSRIGKPIKIEIKDWGDGTNEE